MKPNGLQHRIDKKISPCIWMQAQVVRRRLCEINYECTECRFDRAMRRASDENSGFGNKACSRRAKEAGSYSGKKN